MARSIWTGTLNFGLISIPVKLFTAVRHQAVSFNQLERDTLARIRYQKVAEATGEEVSADQIVKAYEISKDRYVMIEPAELEPFVPSTTKAIDIEEFVGLADIDPVFFDTAYYVAPHLNPKPYVLLARALEKSGKVAIARFVMRSRQYVAALRPADGRLIMSTLAYADEVVAIDDIDELASLASVEVSDRETRMAEALVESLTAEFDPTKYHDDYREQVLDLIARKAAGEEFEVPVAEAEAPKVVDMLAALEASVQAAKAARGRHPTGRADAKKSSTTSKPRSRKSA